MIKKLLTVTALTLVLTSCTADKFEQIDANFALLVEENERINDAIDSNSDDITSLEEALNDAVEYLEDLVEDTSEALTTVIDTLSEETTNVLNQLMDADEVLANDLQTASDSLTDALADLQAQVVTNGETINTALLTQQIVNNAQAADLLALQVALETAEGDAAANLESAIAALESEIAIDFAEFSVDINTLLAGVPSQVRAEVAEALLAISFNASNVLEITVVNPTDELNALEANVVALQLQITQLLAAGSGTSVAISAAQNSDGSVTLMVGNNVYTIPAGAQGAAGIRGIAGSQGIQGIQGLQGTITAGSRGATGTTGAVGVGIPGARGADGTSPTIIATENLDGSVTITINGVDYTVKAGRDSQTFFPIADWITIMNTSTVHIQEYELNNGNRYSVTENKFISEFRLQFIDSGVGQSVVLNTFNSFDEANAAAFAHSIVNP